MKARLFLAAACLALASCSESKKPPPPPPRDSDSTIVVIGARGSGAVARATSLLSSRPLSRPSGTGGVVPDAARSWTHSADFRRWTFDVDRPQEWILFWPGPGMAAGVPGPGPDALVIQLDTPDPDFPARLTAFSPVNLGDYAPPTPLGADWRFFAPRTPGRRALRVGVSDDVEEVVTSFRAGRLSRVDFIPADRATALATDSAFRRTEIASTFVLVVDLENAAERAAVAEALDAGTICKKGLFDPDRAARRIAPAEFALPEPAPARPISPVKKPASVTLAAAEGPAELAALLPPLRSALAKAGISASEPEQGTPSRLRLLLLAPESAAVSDLFAPLRFLAVDHPELAPLFESMDAASDPAERADWAHALESALLASRLVVPVARGRVYSLVKPGSGVELDAWGRYVATQDSAR